MFPFFKFHANGLKFHDQLNILIWKNFKILNYKCFALFVFIVIPILAAVVVFAFRNMYPLIDVPVRYFPAIKASDSLIYTK